MAKVLVTGATGFIGPHLVSHLASCGDEVVCLRHHAMSSARLDPLQPRYVRGDVTDRASLVAAVRDVELVYHLAGLTKALSLAQLLAVNEQGTRNLLDVCAERETPPAVVLVSSLAAGGPSQPGQLREEEQPPAPVSNYGRSKRAAERAAHRFANRVPVTVLRPPVVFGEADRGVLEMFRPIARFGVHVTPGRRDHHFSLIHAADLATALRLAGERGKRIEPLTGDEDDEENHTFPGYYYAAFDEHPTYAEMGRLMAEALGRARMRVVRTPMALTWLVGSASELAGQLFRRARVFNLDKAREAAAGTWTCSPQRIKDQLGWSCGASLPERLKQTAAWYREEGWL